MRETPRPRIVADGAGSAPPQHRTGRALAHTGASCSGILHRSDGRPPQTPRGARHTGRRGRSGTTPPVPERPPLPFRHLPAPRIPLPLVLPVLLFAAVTWQVAAGGPLRRLDERAGAILARPGGEGPGDAWTAPARPDGLPLAAGEGFYPSGHTATAAVAYGAAALLLLPYLRRTAARRALTAGALLLNLAVGAGLVVRGYHWPLDVLGSWLLSVPLLWALAGVLTGRPRGPVRRRPRAAPAPAAPGR
ncbi:phosphatase PAP2 family protein [Streptomyces sp. SID5475]|nr:phosphatase PAP2 family protein [Streptomyces sp. SID5475]